MTNFIDKNMKNCPKCGHLFINYINSNKCPLCHTSYIKKRKSKHRYQKEIEKKIKNENNKT